MSQFTLFAIIGGVNTLLHFGVFLVAYQWLALHYLAASAAGFGIAVINSYLMNRRWTFTSGHRPWRVEFTRFLVVSLAALLVNLLSMLLLVDGFALDPVRAQVVSIAASLLVNFFGNRHWSFSPAR